MELSSKDHELIRALREAGVLQDVEEHLLNQRDGVILVTCADGDQFPDVFQRQTSMQAGQRAKTRIHPLTCHGGALAYAPQSPVNKRKHADLVFLDHVSEARDMKSINTVALYAHTPCGAAHMCEVSIEESIALQMRAKKRILTLNQGIEVACFFHVDYNTSRNKDGRKRTYFLSRERWEVWADENGISSIA